MALARRLIYRLVPLRVYSAENRGLEIASIRIAFRVDRFSMQVIGNVDVRRGPAILMVQAFPAL